MWYVFRTYIESMKRILQWVGAFFLSLVLLVLIAVLFANTKTGKRIIVTKATAYLKSKLGTAVYIGSLDFKVPKWIQLRNVYIKDQAKDTLFFARQLRVEMNMRSLFSNKWILNNILLDGAVIKIRKNKRDSIYNFQYIIDAFTTKETTIKKATTIPQISVAKITLQEVRFRIDDTSQQIYSSIKLLAVKNFRYDMNGVKAQNFLLEKSSIQYDLFAANDKKTEATDSTANKFMLKVDSVALLNNKLVFNRNGRPTIAGFDPNHINIQQKILLVNNLFFNNKESSADIQSLQLVDHTGFSLNQLSLLYQQKGALYKFQQIKIRSAFSSLYGNLQIQPNQYTVSLNNTAISRKDIQLLAPKQLSQLKPSLSEINTVSLNIRAVGNEKKINILQLTATTNNNIFFIKTSGTVRNITEPDLLMYQLEISALAAQKKLFYAFLPKEQQNTIQLPTVLNAVGNLTGTKRTISPHLLITSEYGSLNVSGTINDFTNPNQINYDFLFNAKQFETGKWVRRDSLLGKLNGWVKVKGNGINYKTMQLNTNIRVESFWFKNKQYNNANILLTAQNGLYRYATNINNTLLKAEIKGTAKLNKEYPTLNANFIIRNANLLAMSLLKDSFVLSTKGLIDLNNLNPIALDVLVKLDSVQILSGSKNIQVDTVLFSGKIDSLQKTALSLRSAFMDADILGKFDYTKLGKIITAQINQYIETTATTIAPDPYSLTAAATAKPHAVYAVLLPGLFFSKNLAITAAINSKRNDSSLFIGIKIPELVFNSNGISELNATIWGIKDSLKLIAAVDTLKVSSVLLFNTKLNGGYSKNGFNATVNAKDERGKDLFAFGLTGKKSILTTSFSLNENLLLNYENWLVNKNNQLVLSKEGFYVKDFDFKNKDQQILLNSKNAIAKSPVTVKISRFALSNISSFMSNDSLLLAGRLNVDILVNDFNNTLPSIDGIASIDSLAYQQVAVGNILLKATSNAQTGVDFNAGLIGNGNNVTVVGKYNQQTINANVKLGPMQMIAIEPFTKGNLTRSSGKINGDINISGSVQSPVWKGTVLFDSVNTVVKDYGTVLKLNQQKIDLTYPVINFPQFTITDSLNHNLVINGTLTHTTGFDFTNNLTIKGVDFIAVNNSALSNSQVYGTGIVDVDAEIKGRISTPDIIGNIGLKKDSKITFVRQQTAASANDRVGVIEFIDMDTVKAWSLPLPIFEPLKKSLYASTLNYNLNIDIDKEAEFILVIDPFTRDELSIKGSAQLNARLNPNGSISLIGVYNLSKGTYQMNYSFLKRKFELQEGSTIIFSGDPQFAEADIKALYEINASPFDLIGTEISTNSNNDLYRQKMPFEVVLKIKGQVLEPKLEFDIKLKEKVAGINSQMLTTIENKLLQLRTDASAMNKEVFALLVMGRFIGEQSSDFFAGSNNGIKADQVVKESVSRFLSDAVNQIAADLIKGVDIDVNLRTIDDYSTASQRTDLGLALSKRFLDDRLSISVGKNFTVEGNDPIAKGQNNANVSFLPDVSTAYKLSKDGRYILRAYRRNQYEAILDGYFIETGLAFSLSMDYNKFNELFKKRKTSDEK